MSYIKDHMTGDTWNVSKSLLKSPSRRRNLPHCTAAGTVIFRKSITLVNWDIFG
jgi:hypothetical protein